jgi:Dolichyl-phosphate-mannose-protein mannosyltransferase
MSLLRNRPREEPSSQGAALQERWDVWIRYHSNEIAGMILALGFLVRVWAASGIFLNPDEAQHFLVANRTSLALAYKSSLTLAHPPLLIFVLYFWRYLGDSELVLRMSSIIAGILFCFVFFKWLEIIIGRKAALLSLTFVCLLPPLVSLSAQVRQYSLLLLFMALAAYLFERALAEDSARLMVPFSISLYLAMLSHYSAMFFTASIGIYAVIRLAEKQYSKKLILTWLLSQAGSLALFIFLYRTHISKLKGSSLAEQATEGWLRRSYFHPSQDHVLLFIVGRTFGVFQFIFGHLVIGDVMGLCFIGGVVLLLRVGTAALGCPGGRKPAAEFASTQQPGAELRSAGQPGAAVPTRARPAGWQLAMFFTLPFALNCVAALLGSYPFGGTRHSVFLVVFALAGISFFIAEISRLGTAGSLAVALIIVGACAAFGTPHQPYMTRADQSRVQMERSLAFIQQQIPHSVPLFVDVQTRMLLGYHLCREQQTSAEAPHSDFEVLQCGGYQLIVANVWSFDAATFPDLYTEMIRTYGLRPGDTVWVVQEGWGVGIDQKLSAGTPEFRNLNIESFGNNIQLFKLTVGQMQASSGPEHAPSLRPASPAR